MRVAVYAGTFDPVTRGHLSVIERGARLFDRLLRRRRGEPGKQPLFSRRGTRRRCSRRSRARWPNVACASTEGYVVDLAREHGARYLVRGVRGATDVEAEIALANLNRELAPEIETVFIPAHPELSEVSSSKLKELAREGADLSRYCPPGDRRRAAAPSALQADDQRTGGSPWLTSRSIVLGVGDTFSEQHHSTALLLVCDGFQLAIDCPDMYRVGAARGGRALGPAALASPTSTTCSSPTFTATT